MTTPQDVAEFMFAATDADLDALDRATGDHVRLGRAFSRGGAAMVQALQAVRITTGLAREHQSDAPLRDLQAALYAHLDRWGVDLEAVVGDPVVLRAIAREVTRQLTNDVANFLTQAGSREFADVIDRTDQLLDELPDDQVRPVNAFLLWVLSLVTAAAAADSAAIRAAGEPFPLGPGPRMGELRTLLRDFQLRHGLSDATPAGPPSAEIPPATPPPAQ